MNAIAVRPVAIDRFERPFRLRMPFRFGVTTATEGRQAVVRVRLRLDDGREAFGYAAEALGAKWFDKNLALSDEDNHNQLRKSLELASKSYLDAKPAPPFMLFADRYQEHVAQCDALGLNSLIASYGQSLVDRAIVDAICRGIGISFFDACRKNFIGLAPHAVIGDVGAFEFDAFMDRLRPSDSINVRHTVGLSDPITKDDQSAETRIGDGLPETLEEVIAAYGNRYFKIKISGETAGDLARLERIADVLDRLDSYFVTLDGNEQFADQASIADFLIAMRKRKKLSRFADAILYVEQPINRKMALSEAIDEAADRWPFIIDESDGELSAFVKAKSLGYSGVSSKACKGIYKSIVNSARCALWNAESSERYFMSAEDLTCEPGIALQQDLALVTLLGLSHVERNAHHFIDGFGGRSRDEATAFMHAHADLYHDVNGNVRLRIRDGAIGIGSLDCAGFGTAVEPDLTTLEAMPASTWSPDGDKANVQ